MQQRIPIMVTGVGGGGVGEQILKALRMSALDLLIVGVDAQADSMGLQQVDVPCVVPRADDPGYLESLLKLCARHGVRAVFPGSDAELLALGRNAGALAGSGIYLAANPLATIELCMDKHACALWLASHGFLCPRTVSASSERELALIDFFPLVVKPISGGGGSSDVFIAQDEADLRSIGLYLLRRRGPFLAQEYAGTPEAEYTVGVLCGPEGRIINSIVVHRDLRTALSRRSAVRNETGRADLGPRLVISSGISQGEIGAFPEVARECREVAVALPCTAAVNIQCRFVDGRPSIFEINPRFSGTTSLRALAGYNEPEVLLRCSVLGEKPAADFSYRSGRIFRGLQELADFDSVHTRGLL